ncbi:MAG TPA: hypothetical protein EYP85_14390 [Armatimonadetes bacterium]|nr:hypothetical protein [Armatimonadota bacterium]
MERKIIWRFLLPSLMFLGGCGAVEKAVEKLIPPIDVSLTENVINSASQAQVGQGVRKLDGYVYASGGRLHFSETPDFEGTPVAGAVCQVNGQEVRTDENGFFYLPVEEESPTLTLQKEGYPQEQKTVATDQALVFTGTGGEEQFLSAQITSANNAQYRDLIRRDDLLQLEQITLSATIVNRENLPANLDIFLSLTPGLKEDTVETAPDTVKVVDVQVPEGDTERIEITLKEDERFNTLKEWIVERQDNIFVYLKGSSGEVHFSDLMTSFKIGVEL